MGKSQPPRVSPRKTKGTQPYPQTKPERQPQRCKKCPGRPLRSQCEHTKAGVTYLRKKEIEQSISSSLTGALDPLRPSEHLPETTQGPPISAFTHPISIPEPNIPSTDVTVAAPAPVIDPALQLPVPFPEPQLYPPGFQRRLQTSHADPVTPTPNSRVSGDFVFPPIVTAYAFPPLVSNLSSPGAASDVFSQSQSSSMSLQQTPSLLQLTPTAQSSESNSDQQSPNTPTPSSTAKSARTSRSNNSQPQKVGQNRGDAISGTLRGLNPHWIFRTRDTKPPKLTSKQSSKTFLAKYNRLVESTDILARQTGAWVFLAAQHPAATGGTLSYTSPRLLTDAPPEADQMVLLFDRTGRSLLQARRSQAMDLQRKHDALLKENAAMADQNALMAQTIAELRAGQTRNPSATT